MKSVLSFIFLIAAGFFLLPVQARCSPTEKNEIPLELLFYSRNTPTQFIVVEKQHQKLSVFEQADRVKLIREFECATGQNPGPKKISGDSRTPEGIYFITEIYEDKRITVFGSRAFHLDYPNVFDTHAGHRGDGIFIHGTNKKLNPNSTNGCIVLNNLDLDELVPYLSVNTIPIIVLDALPEPLVGKNLLLDADTSRFTDILGALSFDLKKIPVRDIQTFSFLQQGERAVASIKYTTYERDHIQYREQVRTYLTQSPVGTWRSVYAVQSQEKNPYLLALRPHKNDELVTKLAAAPQPEQAIPAEPPIEPTQVVPLEPPVQLASTQPMGPMKATSAVQPAEPARSAKADRSAPSTPQPAVANHPAVAKNPQLTRSEELLNFVEKWRSAWVAKDIEAYIGCYSPSFKNGGLNREGWKQKKMSLNKKYTYISVSIKNIVVQWTPTGAKVSFSQTYKSDQYQTTGTKVLQVTNKNNRWLIEGEIM